MMFRASDSRMLMMIMLTMGKKHATFSALNVDVAGQMAEMLQDRHAAEQHQQPHQDHQADADNHYHVVRPRSGPC